MKVTIDQWVRRKIGLLFFLLGTVALAQPGPGVYMATEDSGERTWQHKIVLSDQYITHTVYSAEPAEFVYTRGGFFTSNDEAILIKLEFNSNFEEDGLKELSLPYRAEGDRWVIGEKDLKFTRSVPQNQELDGHWLFATRGPDTGQERRDDSNPRKTLKVLADGSFQWIAYHVGDFRFMGSGGGSFSSENGVYTENIEFFSRDNARVGARLDFNYEIEGDDWHHSGKNSRGEPLYEIWSRR